MCWLQRVAGMLGLRAEDVPSESDEEHVPAAALANQGQVLVSATLPRVLMPWQQGVFRDIFEDPPALQCELPEPPLNDIRWIMSLASQPGDLLPDRSLALQRMQQAIYTSWRERVGAGEASLLAKTAAELADNTLYLMALRLLWPLLSSDQQLEVQQWFRRYAGTSGPSGAASASSSSKPRPGLDG